ncbi:MAG TPA: NADH-quinone oxidoreductase subunit NuoF [Aggregatilinea sp.]|nr:NADH-quinone oxidoreductase subunit NuoF [Aggregatilinea sp.]HML22564.1 NADH-quinone oxidoreductase subunit NuoF [Aggregatilinea sp.]
MMTYDELAELAAESREKQQQYKYCLRVCMAAGCLSQHSDSIKAALEDEVKAQGRDHEIQIKGVGCLGLCAAGPLVAVEPDNVLYEKVQAEDAPALIASIGKEPISELRCDEKMPFFSRQTKIVLENSGVIDPESLEDYLNADGYKGLYRVLTEMSPSEVIDEIMESGLRGRGGAGYPTGLKWATVAKASGDVKYVICNGDEGDPGAFMDRSVLESDPYRILEGMTIAGYAVGSNRGYVYVRAEYPLAIDRLKLALRQAKRNNLLGENILGTGFDFNLEIRLGAGAYVCGEETALMGSIEGHRGTPRPRPPYPADHGLWGQPTLINNVETYANIAPIIRNGSAWFSSIGTESSKGTKVFALAGQVKNTGLIEVPMGISLREIVEVIGGGTTGSGEFKAVQTGGPTGGCIPAEYLDVPVDYSSLTRLGSIMGSGGMIIMDKTSSMVDVAKYFMEFCKSESCGKCIPCRVGTAQMYGLLDKISKGQATMADLDLLEQLCDLVRNASLCGLGGSAPNPIMSTLKYFRSEYLEKIIDAPVLEPAAE